MNMIPLQGPASTFTTVAMRADSSQRTNTVQAPSVLTIVHHSEHRHATAATISV